MYRNVRGPIFINRSIHCLVFSYYHIFFCLSCVIIFICCNYTLCLGHIKSWPTQRSSNQKHSISDKLNAFNLNGLEIDLDELEAFERRVQAKREAKKQQEQLNHQNIDNTTTTTIATTTNTTTVITSPTTETSNETPEIDELDEYLKTLRLKEQKEEEEEKQKQLQPQPPFSSNSQSSPLNFAILLYWFLAILNLASATFCKHYSKSSDNNWKLIGYMFFLFLFLF